MPLPAPSAGAKHRPRDALGRAPFPPAPQYFDVDTREVGDRLLYALSPVGRQNSFRDVVAGNPDLYGPFWICATLIFTIAVTSNLSSYLSFTKPSVRAGQAPRLGATACAPCANAAVTATAIATAGGG